MELPLELVEPADVVGALGAEHRGLELVDVLGHRARHVDEVVDDVVGDGIEDGGRAQPQQVPLLLQAGPQVGEPRVLAVPHGDHVVRAEEHHDLAGVDHLAGRGQLLVLHVPRGLEHHEQGFVVVLELGSLVGVDRVLDGQRVQPVLRTDRAELLLRRLVHAQPHEPAPGRGLLQGIPRRDRFLSDPVDVDGAVDDHRLAGSAGRRRARRAHRTGAQRRMRALRRPGGLRGQVRGSRRPAHRPPPVVRRPAPGVSA
jgi:hypothetical protein